MRILLALLPWLVATVLPAQTATVSFYGAGCSFVGQSLAIGVQGLPQLGTTITFTYSGPNQNGPLTVQPVLGLGLSATSVPIPQSLLFQQPAGCTQLIVPEVLVPMPLLATGQFDTQIPMSIPSAPALVGFTFTAQWVAFGIQCGIVPPCQLHALPTSDAAVLTVGL